MSLVGNWVKKEPERLEDTLRLAARPEEKRKVPKQR
jgi:hypothetical protein